MDNKKNSHDSSILGDKQHGEWHEEAGLGLLSRQAQGPSYEHVPKRVQCFTMESSNSSYKSIFIKSSQMLNSI